jgi:hypothetical protein
VLLSRDQGLALPKLERHLSRITKLDAVTFLVLVFAAFTTVAQKFDLVGFDEAIYFNDGYTFNTSPEAGARSPSYAWLYSLARLLTADPVNVAFYGRLAGCLIFVLGTWLAVRLVSDSLRAFLIAALLPFISVWYIWTGVSAFAGGVLAMAIATAYRWRNAWGYSASSCLVWIAAIARPEFQLAAIFVTLVALVQLVRAVRDPFKRHLYLPLAALLAVGVPVIVWSVYAPPLSSASQDRLWLAFGQHYAIQNVGKSGLDPWDQWTVFTHQDFGNATNMMGALKANPLALSNHVFLDVFKVPRMGMASMVDTSSILSWFAVGVFGAFAILAMGMWRRGARLHGFRQEISRWRTVWVTIFALSVVGVLLDILIIYPEEHYFAPLVSMVAVVMAIGLGSVSQGWRKNWAGKGAFIACSLLMVAALVVAPLSLGSVWSHPRPYVSAVRALDGCPAGVRLYATDFGPQVYAPSIVQITPKVSRRTDLASWLQANHVDAVYETPLLTSRWPSRYWEDFQSQPQKFGFRPFPSKSAGATPSGSRFFLSNAAGC